MNDKYEKIYLNLEKGLFNQRYFSIEDGDVVGVSVELLKAECIKQGVDFEKLLEYARKRKAER